MRLTTPKRSSILVIDDDPLIVDLVDVCLAHAGFDVMVARTGCEGITTASRRQPHLILLDVMLPDMDGVAVCRALRDNELTKSIPIIMLSALDTNEHKVSSFAYGADDYIVKPFHVPELLARVQTQLRHVLSTLLSDLTGLPGNTLIERIIRWELECGGEDLAILYVDLDDFKAYNDAYGFLAGNELIRLTACVLQEVMASWDAEHSFCGHIGGDDFVIVTRTSTADKLSRDLIAAFEARRDDLYSSEDRARGYIVSMDRRGNTQQFPLASLSIGVVTTRNRHLKDEWEVSHIAAEVKKQAKSLGGSAFYIDQRENF